MRHAWVLVSLVVALVGLAVGAGLPAGAIAQEGTPPPDEEFELPEGVSFDALGYGAAAALPAAPADLALFRFGFEPGAGFPLDAEASLALVYVEAGVLTFAMEGPITVLRAAGAGTPFPMQTETVAAGEAIELAAGDSAVFPAGVGGEVCNEGDERATILVADVSPTEEEVGTAAAGTPTP